MYFIILVISGPNRPLFKYFLSLKKWIQAIRSLVVFFFFFRVCPPILLKHWDYINNCRYTRCEGAEPSRHIMEFYNCQSDIIVSPNAEEESKRIIKNRLDNGDWRWILYQFVFQMVLYFLVLLFMFLVWERPGSHPFEYTFFYKNQ